MTKQTSPFPLKAVRYSVGYMERYFTFVWNRTGWVWRQSNKYLAWVKGQNIHPGFRVIFYLFLVNFLILWVLILLFGLLKAI